MSDRYPHLRPAVRNDYDTPLFLNYLWGLLRCTAYKCPHCRHIFRLTWSPEVVGLGPGLRTCSACGQGFDEGSQEWPAMNSTEKWQYLVPTWLSGVIGGVGVCVGTVLLFGIRGQINWSAFVALLLLLAAVLVPWLCIRLLKIAR